jgi:pimeloyl-ACP methyl ester carboxylesterase
MTSITLPLSDPDQQVALQDIGGGAPVLLVHGVGMQSAAWGPQIEALGEAYRVIAVDMPGHGGSSPLPSGSQLPDFVHWLYDVVCKLDVGPVSVAGHSMGALIAAGFAITHPGLTTRVALLNSVFRRNDAARTAVIVRAAEIRTGKVDLETPLARWFGDGPADNAARTLVAGWLGAVDQDGYATAYAAFAQGDATYADGFVDIACPFLAITGDGDPNSTPAMARAMAAEAQNGRAVTIPGHRHMVNLTAPDEVNLYLQAWLDLPVSQEEPQ